MNYSSSWAVFPVTWWVDTCQYPLKRFFWWLPLHSLFLAQPHRLPSHRGWAQRRDLCPWCCLAAAWWCPGAEPCTIHSSVSFLTFREAGLSGMHISFCSPAFLLCRSPLTKWLWAHLGLCPKCFHFLPFSTVRLILKMSEILCNICVELPMEAKSFLPKLPRILQAINEMGIPFNLRRRVGQGWDTERDLPRSLL